MKFTKITIENFLTLKSAEARLDERGLVLVEGENRDDTSQDSNGAGKSSLADAVSWALYGITARGETGNDVINNKISRGGAKVALDIDDAGNHYRIERTRLKGKGTLELSRLDKGKWVTLTKGTTKLTQDAINKLIGCSAEVFTNAIYSGQEQTPDLPGMTDKMLKMLIEEAAGILRLERAYKVARERMNDTSKAIEVEQTTHANAERLVQVRKDNIDRLIAAQDDWATNHKRQLKELALSIKTAQTEAVTAQSHFDTLSKDRPTLTADLNTVNARLSGVDGFREAVTEADRIVSGLGSDLRHKQVDLRNEEARLKALKEERGHADDIVGTDCKTCGKPHTAEDVEPHKHRLKAELDSGIKRYKRLVEERDLIEKKLSIARAELSKAQAAVPDTSAEIKRRDELSDALRAIQNAERDARTAAERVRERMTQLKALKAQVNPNDKLLADERALLTKAKEECKASADRLTGLDVDLALKRAAAQVFGPAGVRAHILDTVTPFLNDRTSHYLSALTDNNISALWSTIDTNAKGEVKEKFGIAVQSKVGAKTFKGLSGGEKRKVRLACSMALQDLVSSRATKPIELYIADEIDHALDESGLERLMGILEDKASDRGTVLVISHNSLSDWIRQTVTVVKEGGVSRLEGTALA